MSSLEFSLTIVDHIGGEYTREWRGEGPEGWGAFSTDSATWCNHGVLVGQGGNTQGKGAPVRAGGAKRPATVSEGKSGDDPNTPRRNPWKTMAERREAMTKLRKLLETAQELEMGEEELRRLQNKLDKAIKTRRRKYHLVTYSRALRGSSRERTIG
jgi:hypothetical protein